MDDPPARETVVLLHGLARGRISMWPLERALRRRGYDVINLHHPTRRLDLAGLAGFVRERLAAMVPDPGRAPTLHGVGHSLGGLVLLAVLLDPPPPWQARRLVTLGSPYRGARVAADLAPWRAARQFFGPVLADLAPGSAALRAALAQRPAPLEVGVIAGAGRLRPLAPAVLFDRRRALMRTTDGTVEMRSALGASWLFPFADRLVVDASHTLLPTSPAVIRATIAFLEHGRFPPLADHVRRARP
jgi:pimeloyl-ACP methyl ester carboxylesterase